MKTSTAAIVGSWLLAIPLQVASIAHAIFRCRMWGQLMSGNSFIDPVGFLLSYLTPVAATGVGTLALLKRRGKVQGWSITLAATLVVCFTAGVLVFGVWLFRGMSGFYLSDLVWWLKPFRLAGV